MMTGKPTDDADNLRVSGGIKLAFATVDDMHSELINREGDRGYNQVVIITENLDGEMELIFVQQEAHEAAELVREAGEYITGLLGGPNIEGFGS